MGYNNSLYTFASIKENVKSVCMVAHLQPSESLIVMKYK